MQRALQWPSLPPGLTGAQRPPRVLPAITLVEETESVATSSMVCAVAKVIVSAAVRMTSASTQATARCRSVRQSVGPTSIDAETVLATVATTSGACAVAPIWESAATQVISATGKPVTCLPAPRRVISSPAAVRPQASAAPTGRRVAGKFVAVPVSAARSTSACRQGRAAVAESTGGEGTDAGVSLTPPASPA